jgi:thioredoxin reductase (NADPH)
MISNPVKKYDVVIIGGGPAGLSAGIYAARGRQSTLLIEKGAVGGQIINAELVENYPGFADGISGIDLTQTMHRQATKFGLETLYAEVTAIEVNGKQKTVKTSDGDFIAGAIIITGGAERQKLGVPGEGQYTGKGVSYCATCDGAFFRNKKVVVVGGGNVAVTEALELTRFASKVTVIHRRNELRATKIVQEKAFANPKIEFLWDSAVEAITGNDFVKKITVANLKTGKKSVMDVDGVFVSVGSQPATGYLKGILTLDVNGAIIVNDRLETSVPGIFAAGDIRSGSIRQVVPAAGDGAVAAINAGKHISE